MSMLSTFPKRMYPHVQHSIVSKVPCFIDCGYAQSRHRSVDEFGKGTSVEGRGMQRGSVLKTFSNIGRFYVILTECGHTNCTVYLIITCRFHRFRICSTMPQIDRYCSWTNLAKGHRSKVHGACKGTVLWNYCVFGTSPLHCQLLKCEFSH